MKIKYIISRFALAMLLLCVCAGKVFCQLEEVVEKKIDQIDTLNTHSFYFDLDFQFHLSHQETDDYRDLRFVHATKYNYLFRHSDIELNFRQILERASDGHLYYNHYAMLSSGLFKYRPVGAKKTIIRPLHPELLLISQNNTGRGLHWRFQTGALFHPFKVIYPKFKTNFGIGFVYDWSSWEVNNEEKINDVEPEMRKKIRFINSNTKLKRDMYQNHNELRPMLLLNAYYTSDDVISLHWLISYQQSLMSPFNETIKNEYPELKKVYPYIFSQFSVSAQIYKGLAFKSTIMLDYENNNLSIYASSWEYRVLFGIVWKISNQKS